MSRELHEVAIVGGGMMGRSIAVKVAQQGIHVRLKEASEGRVDACRVELERELDRAVQRFDSTDVEKRAVLSRIRWGTGYEGVRACDLAIETVQEDAELKRGILLELDRQLPPDRPVVINTSTLSITELAAACAHPERVLGMHFLYPVTQARVVEVVRGQLTSDAVLEQAMAFARLLDKVPIKCFEMPGFVTTRAILPLINEAIHVVMEGVAEAPEVDLAMKLGYDFRTGPLEWADRVGLDKVLNWMQHLHQETGEPRFRPCPLLKRLVRAGLLGTKTGRGFFTYGPDRERTDRLPDDRQRLG